MKVSFLSFKVTQVWKFYYYYSKIRIIQKGCISGSRSFGEIIFNDSTDLNSKKCAFQRRSKINLKNSDYILK